MISGFTMSKQRNVAGKLCRDHVLCPNLMCRMSEIEQEEEKTSKSEDRKMNPDIILISKGTKVKKRNLEILR